MDSFAKFTIGAERPSLLQSFRRQEESDDEDEVEFIRVPSKKEEDAKEMADQKENLTLQMDAIDDNIEKYERMLEKLKKNPNKIISRAKTSLFSEIIQENKERVIQEEAFEGAPVSIDKICEKILQFHESFKEKLMWNIYQNLEWEKVRNAEETERLIELYKKWKTWRELPVSPDEKFVKNEAKIPDMIPLSDARRRYLYVNTNRTLGPSGLAARVNFTESEKKTFMESFGRNFKQFGLISTEKGLEAKTTMDCVAFYYKIKKLERLKRKKKKKHSFIPAKVEKPTNDQFLETEWKQSEFEKLMEAISLHGKNWVRVALHVGNRSIVSCQRAFRVHKRRITVETLNQ